MCPDAHDPLTARIVDMADFDAIHMTGFGTSLARSGYADVGLTTLTEVLDNARKFATQVDVPVFCDADDGYGDVRNVIRTVEEFVHTGVAGIHLEDQATPKRGIISGHEVVSEDRFLSKVEAACDVRDEHDEDFVVVARSDAPGAENATLDDAIARLNGAVDLGADAAFVIGQSTEEEVIRVGEEIDAPLVYDWNGYHPRLNPETLTEYGYDVAIVSMLATRATMIGVYRRAKQLEEGLDVTFEMMDEIEDLDRSWVEFAGFSKVLEWEEAYGQIDVTDVEMDG